MLTQQQVDFYHENGYLGVNGVYTADEMDELRQVTDDFVEQSRGVTEHTDVFDLEPGHMADAPRLRRLKNPIQYHPVYERALHHDRMLDAVAQLIGPAIRTNGNKLNMKSAGFGSPVEWHQDWSFFGLSNVDFLGVGVSVEDLMV